MKKGNKKSLSIISIIIGLFVTSCVSTRYIGDYYSPTNELEVYYDDGNIPYEYETFGHIVGSDGSSESIITKIKEEAMLNGANAILIKEIDVDTENELDINDTIIKASLIRYINN